MILFLLQLMTKCAFEKRDNFQRNKLKQNSLVVDVHYR